MLIPYNLKKFGKERFYYFRIDRMLRWTFLIRSNSSDMEKSSAKGKASQISVICPVREKQ